MVVTYSNPSNMLKKTTQGRKKIEIKKIEQVNNRQVTFSKRRAGLFKKASELSVLTGAELAIIVHSPSGRVFAFGHPSVDQVVERYLNIGTTLNSKEALKTLIPQSMNELNQHYSEISKELEKEKRKKDVIEETNSMKSGEAAWWEQPIDGLALEELQQFVPSLEELKKKLLMRADELMMIRSSSLCMADHVNQAPNQVVGLGNYENIVYSSTNSPLNGNSWV